MAVFIENLIDILSFLLVCRVLLSKYTYGDIGIRSATINEESSVVSEGDFYSRIVSKRICVDNSALIIAYFRQNLSSVILVRRPRKWGKSMNLDMIKRFLEIETNSTTGRPLSVDKRINKKLFVGGRIRLADNKVVDIKSPYVSKFDFLMNMQGSFPTIHLDLANISANDIERRLKNKLDRLYNDHRYLKRYLDDDNTILNESDKKKLRLYIDKDYGLLELKESLRFLSKMLFLHYKRKVHVLIDNYDAPISGQFFKMVEDYRKNEVDNKLPESAIFRKVIESEDFQRNVGLLREILENCLQRNEAISKALITGVLRFAEADPFANYTNLKDYTIFDKEFNEFYGFSQDEVDEMLYTTGLAKKVDQIAEWYSGYRYGDRDNDNDKDLSLYNPWSLIRCLENDGVISNYWINRDQFERLMSSMSDETRRKLRDLTDGKTVRITTGKRITTRNDDILLDILLFAGYLTPDNVTRLEDVKYTCRVSIPNREIINTFEEKFKK